MKKDLQHIREKIASIQFGILKSRDEEGSQSWQVKAASNDELSFHCMVTDERPCADLVNKTINLVQKHKDDYLYITGRVSAEALAAVHQSEQKKSGKPKILSIDILKACWFVRHTKGKVSWLKQKYMYEQPGLELAS